MNIVEDFESFEIDRDYNGNIIKFNCIQCDDFKNYYSNLKPNDQDNLYYIKLDGSYEEIKSMLDVIKNYETVMYKKHKQSIEEYKYVYLKLPNTIDKIEERVFSSIYSLCRIKLPTNIVSIERNAFENCINLKEIEIPNSVLEIKRNAFTGCEKLKTVKIKGPIQSLGVNSFSYCLNLSKIELPNTIESIESAAFWGCEKLSDISLPNSFKKFGNDVFFRCFKLDEIKFAGSEQEWKSIVGINTIDKLININCEKKEKEDRVLIFPSNEGFFKKIFKKLFKKT